MLPTKDRGSSLLELLTYIIISSIIMMSLLPEGTDLTLSRFTSACLDLKDFVDASKSYRTVNLELANEQRRLIAHTPHKTLGFMSKYKLAIANKASPLPLKYDFLTYSPQRILLIGPKLCSVIVSLRGQTRLEIS